MSKMTLPSPAAKKSLNLALVCGDGLPISGLLTTFRNVLDLLNHTHTPSSSSSSSSSSPPLITLPIPTDLGYSWRPDKPSFFPHGPPETFYPSWLAVTAAVPVPPHAGYADELLAIRRDVSHASVLSAAQTQALHARVEAIAGPYEQHFEAWFAENDVDWVCAVNMTLSDAVPVTRALHRAAARRWGLGGGAAARPGGVLFWDHDLLSSYAVHERNARLYPLVPNEFTLVPQAVPWHLWAVVSEVLEPETRLYPTQRRALVVPNVLPTLEETGELKL